MTLREASQKSGIPAETIHYRMRECMMTIEEAMEAGTRLVKPVLVKGLKVGRMTVMSTERSMDAEGRHYKLMKCECGRIVWKLYDNVNKAYRKGRQISCGNPVPGERPFCVEDTIKRPWSITPEIEAAAKEANTTTYNILYRMNINDMSIKEAIDHKVGSKLQPGVDLGKYILHSNKIIHTEKSRTREVRCKYTGKVTNLSESQVYNLYRSNNVRT
jgi:hypothetical protein